MTEKNKEVLAELFEKLYKKSNREEIESLIVKIKSKLENLAGVDAFVTARVKSPISIIKKFESDEVYRKSWNNMKDLIGLMIVVDKNSDVDDVIYYLETEFFDKKKNNV